jgi:hypothetical protein
MSKCLIKSSQWITKVGPYAQVDISTQLLREFAEGPVFLHTWACLRISEPVELKFPL